MRTKTLIILLFAFASITGFADTQPVKDIFDVSIRERLNILLGTNGRDIIESILQYDTYHRHRYHFRYSGELAQFKMTQFHPDDPSYREDFNIGLDWSYVNEIAGILINLAEQGKITFPTEVMISEMTRENAQLYCESVKVLQLAKSKDEISEWSVAEIKVNKFSDGYAYAVIERTNCWRK